MDEANALRGRRIVVPESRELDLFARMLEAQGAETLRCPMVTILDAEEPAPIEAWLKRFAAGQFDERALFHLLNLAREEGAFLLLTARSAPAGWKLAIPDLASRLKALPVVALTAPDDVLLRGVLVKLFADRQLAVDESLVGFLVKRIERSIAAARAVVAMLDEEAMRQKRPLTRALAAEILR